MNPDRDGISSLPAGYPSLIRDPRSIRVPTSAILLLGSLALIRVLPTVTRPASAADDCERVSRVDAPALERCLAVRPDDVELMIDLADLQAKAGNRDAAVELYRRALTVDPEDGELRRRIGGER